MTPRLTVVTILVEDQDAAIEFDVDALGFDLRTDEEFGPGARWVMVAPPEQTDVEIHLQAPTPALLEKEGAGRLRERFGEPPAWSFQTDDVHETYDEHRSAGGSLPSDPTERPYGSESVFEDLYGNQGRLLKPADRSA